MTDVLGKNSLKYYTKEQAKLYNLSGAFKRIQTRMTYEALEIGDFPKGTKVLDLGCGTGFSTMVIKKYGHKVIGCDINENMLLYAKKKGLKAIQCNMNELPFSDEEFDHLISISTIQWAKPREYSKVLSEINRVIKTSAVIQFYPKSNLEQEYFMKQAKKYFLIESFRVGEGNKKKTYIRLKKKL